MANLFDFSQLNPLKFYQQADVFNTGFTSPLALNAFNPNINIHTIDNDFSYFNLQSWVDKVKYWQRQERKSWKIGRKVLNLITHYLC